MIKTLMILLSVILSSCIIIKYPAPKETLLTSHSNRCENIYCDIDSAIISTIVDPNINLDTVIRGKIIEPGDSILIQDKKPHWYMLWKPIAEIENEKENRQRNEKIIQNLHDSCISM